MASPNRFAIRDAGIATFYNIATGKAIVSLATLKTNGVETTGETVFARGGKGNAKIIGFSSNRESKLTLEDAIFDIQSLGMLTGNSVITGAQVLDRNQVLPITSNTLTLAKTPTGAIVSVYKLNADGTNGQEYTLGTPATNATEYSVSAKILTFHTSVTNGTQFRVYYKVNAPIDAKMVKVTSDQFGKTFRVTLDVTVVDEYTKDIYAAQLQVPNAKFLDEFNFSMAADGDPATLNLSMEILKSATSNDMWSLVIFDDALIV